MKMKKITEVLIGSNNKGKVREIKALLPKKVNLGSFDRTLRHLGLVNKRLSLF